MTITDEAVEAALTGYDKAKSADVMGTVSSTASREFRAPYMRAALNAAWPHLMVKQPSAAERLKAALSTPSTVVGGE